MVTKLAGRALGQGAPVGQQPGGHPARRLPDLPDGCGAGVLSAPQEAGVPVGHASARSTAGSLVVVVDTQSRLNHHVAVVVPVLAVFIDFRDAVLRVTRFFFFWF